MKTAAKGLLYAGFTALLWGFLAIALKVAVTDLNPVTVVWFRFSFAFILLLVALLIFDKKIVSSLRKLPTLVIVAAIFLGLNYLGFITGIQKTGPGTAQVFIQIGPVSLAIAGVVIFKEKFTRKQLMGLVFLLGGFYLFYSEQIIGKEDDGNIFLSGIIFIVLGGLSWAAFSVVQKILVKNHNPNHLNLVIYGICAVGFLPFIEWSVLPDLDLYDWLLMAFLGLNTFLAYGSLALALKFAEANKISMIITLNPILTFVAMAILEFLSVSWIEYENLTVLSIAGALIVLTGVMIVVLGKGRRG